MPLDIPTALVRCHHQKIAGAGICTGIIYRNKKEPAQNGYHLDILMDQDNGNYLTMARGRRLDDKTMRSTKIANALKPGEKGSVQVANAWEISI